MRGRAWFRGGVGSLSVGLFLWWHWLFLILFLIYLLNLLLQSSYLFVLRVELLLHLQVSCCRVGDLPSTNLTNLAEYRLVVQLGSFDQRIRLVDGLCENWVKLGALRSELDGVVDSVFDLTYHILGTLELEITQVHFN